VHDGALNHALKAQRGLRVHIIGAKATEMIAEFSLGKILETTVDEIAHTIHPHPTISETIMEAAHVAMGGAIHL
jgi:dihydrolipoamide dehydrogenase